MLLPRSLLGLYCKNVLNLAAFHAAVEHQVTVTGFVRSSSLFTQAYAHSTLRTAMLLFSGGKLNTARSESMYRTGKYDS